VDIHAEAELFVLPETDGGRKSPFFSGYLPGISFDGVYNGLTINNRIPTDGLHALADGELSGDLTVV